jgi:hypothetical protein
MLTATAPSASLTPAAPLKEIKTLADLEQATHKVGNLELQFVHDNAGGGDTGYLTIRHLATEQISNIEIPNCSSKVSTIIAEFGKLKGALTGDLKYATELLIESVQDLEAKVSFALHTGDSKREVLSTLLAETGTATMHSFTIERQKDVEVLNPTDSIKDPLNIVRTGSDKIICSLGDRSVEVILGEKPELTVTLPGPKGPQRIAIQLTNIDEATLENSLREVLKLVKEADPLTVLAGTESARDGSTLSAKLLEIGQISLLENVEVKNVIWTEGKLAKGITLRNVVIEDSHLELVGRIEAKNLETKGVTQLWVDSPRSTFESCTFGSKTTLMGDLSSSVFFGPQNMLGEQRAVRLACNALNCSLLGIKFRDSFDGPDRRPTWYECRGLVCSLSGAPQELLKLGHRMSVAEFAKHVEQADANSLNLAGKRYDSAPDLLAALYPELLTVSSETIAANGAIQKHSLTRYVFRSQDEYREVRLELTSDPRALFDESCTKAKFKFGTLVDDSWKYRPQATRADIASTLFETVRFLKARCNSANSNMSNSGAVVIDSLKGGDMSASDNPDAPYVNAAPATDAVSEAIKAQAQTPLSASSPTAPDVLAPRNDLSPKERLTKILAQKGEIGAQIRRYLEGEIVEAEFAPEARQALKEIRGVSGDADKEAISALIGAQLNAVKSKGATEQIKLATTNRPALYEEFNDALSGGVKDRTLSGDLMTLLESIRATNAEAKRFIDRKFPEIKKRLNEKRAEAERDL